jgi:hypothetical protein
MGLAKFRQVENQENPWFYQRLPPQNSARKRVGFCNTKTFFVSRNQGVAFATLTSQHETRTCFDANPPKQRHGRPKARQSEAITHRSQI